MADEQQTGLDLASQTGQNNIAEALINHDVANQVVHEELVEAIIGVLKALRNTPIQTTSLTLMAKTITERGTYLPADDNVGAYSEIDAENIPNVYDVSDEGKVVDNSELVSQTSRTITENDTYDTTLNDEVVVDVPNSYIAADEGKVVSEGELVSQTSETITENGIYDTTLNDEVTVDVQSSESSFVRLEPISEDIYSGYVASGNWNAGIQNPRCYSDVYLLTPGHRYYVRLGAVVSTRFRLMLSSIDPTSAANTLIGKIVYEKDNPSAYECAGYNPYGGCVFDAFSIPDDSSYIYLTISKSNNGTANIETFVFDVTVDL